MRYGKYMRIRSDQNQILKDSNYKRKIMEQEMENQIWEFIDGHCSEAEKAFVLQQLADSAAWKSKYEELISVHEMLRKEELEMPSMRFTRNVMEEITQYQVAPATKNYINKNVIRSIFAFFLIMISGLLIYFIGQIHWSGQSTGTLVPAYSLDANKLNWGKMLNNSYVNIFIGISAILGLILVDKYLQTKRNQGHTGH
jgi:hypothetical protein